MYFLRRLLSLPLSLFLLSLAVFGLQQAVPTDPVVARLPAADARLATSDATAYDELYRNASRELGLDRPAFYLSLRNAALPDTLHRIARPAERRLLRQLTLTHGNWPRTQEFYRAYRRYLTRSHADPATQLFARTQVQRGQQEAMGDLAQRLPEDPAAEPLRQALTRLREDESRGNLLGIQLDWHGPDNRYHAWLTGLFRGDFGRSYVDQRPVATKIAAALPWSLLLNGVTLITVFLFSIPLGLYLARHAGSRRDTLLSVLLFIAYGIPYFWIATLLANYLTTPAYGLDLFPSMGFGEVPPDAGWFTLLRVRAAHLILPVFSLSLGGLAYLTWHLRRSGTDEFGRAYVRTARMKGLTERSIARRHVLRNALFPLITVGGSILPGLLAGSVIVERIFNLPGMGNLIYEASVSGDWPVLLSTTLLFGAATALGLLLADVGYYLADPRVRLGHQRGEA